MKRGLNIGNLKVNLSFSNKVVYTIISIFFLIAVGVGVYAVPGIIPNPGHSFSQLQACSNGEILKTSGGLWTCAADNVSAGGGSSVWTQSGLNVYYNSGNVGIGTSTPTQKLDVAGNIQASGTICDSTGCIGVGGSSSGSSTNTQNWYLTPSNPTSSGSNVVWDEQPTLIGVTMSVDNKEVIISEAGSYIICVSLGASENSARLSGNLRVNGVDLIDGRIYQPPTGTNDGTNNGPQQSRCWLKTFSAGDKLSVNNGGPSTIYRHEYSSFTGFKLGGGVNTDHFYGVGRPDVQRHGTTGPESGLCTNGAVKFGLSWGIADWGSADSQCPAGTWVCTKGERGIASCNTDRPNTNTDGISCSGTSYDYASSDHVGWVLDNSAGSGNQWNGHWVSEAGTAGSSGHYACDSLPVWCCSAV